jgi:hypothetical protein
MAYCVRFGVYTAVLMKIQVFCDGLLTFQRIMVPSSSGSRSLPRSASPYNEGIIVLQNIRNYSPK